MKKTLLLLTFFILTYSLYAQTSFPNWDLSYWTLDAGLETSNVLVDGNNIGLLLVPKLRLTPNAMLGSKIGVNYSFETRGDDIIAIESQVFFRWDILRDGFTKLNMVPFIQGGIGYLGAFRGDDVRDTRASVLLDFTAGLTIPINSVWHIEPQIRGGFPFQFGIGITIGRRFPITQRTDTRQESGIPESSPQGGIEYVDRETVRTEYVDREVVRTEYIYIEPEAAGTENELAQTGNELARTRSDLDRTESELAQTGNELARTRTDLDRAESELAQTRNELARAEDELARTRRDLERAETDAVRTEYVDRETVRIEYVDREVVRTEYVEVLRTPPPEQITGRLVTTAVEFVLFGPNIGRYNEGVDRDVRALNELTLDQAAQVLRDNPDLHVRIEGHANPVTADTAEAEELMTLSLTRANEVAVQLGARGVNEEQITVTAFGGTRTVTRNQLFWNRNRRVELIIIQVDAD